MANEVKFYETKEFKELNKKWKGKLKASGFKDLEDAEDPDAPLPTSTDPRTRRSKESAQVQDYYQKALHYLENGTFTSMRQKAMWQMHANGDSLQEIATARMISKSAVDYHIQQVKKRMFAGE